MPNRTIIVPAGQVTALASKLKNDLHPGLDGMFTTPLSSTGNLPATHYVSSGWMSQAESEFLNAQLPKPFQGNDSGEGPHEMFARVGLKMITTEL